MEDNGAIFQLTGLGDLNVLRRHVRPFVNGQPQRAGGEENGHQGDDGALPAGSFPVLFPGGLNFLEGCSFLCFLWKGRFRLKVCQPLPAGRASSEVLLY